MALVNVVNMVVLDNPTCFTSPFQFEITFECLQELDDDLEWKVLYVGSAQDAAKDQILDEILVGPVPVGVNKFVLQADAPDPSQLAQDDLLGVTVVLVTCSYKEREFVRVGYYVNNEYHDPNSIATTTATATISQTASGSQTQTEEAAPPVVPNPVPLDRIQRQILADKPRVTKFPISWGDEPQQQQQQQQQYQQQQHQQQHPMPQSAAGVTGSSVGAAMMADHAAATGGIGIPSPAPVVTPTISNHHDASAAAAASDNANVHAGDNSNIHESSMREEGYNGEEELMEEDEEDDDDDNGENDIDDDEGEEDIMDEEELSVDSETGERAGEGIVSMPEESNMSHAYFGHSSTSGGNTTAANNNNNNVEAMAE
eukprot:jgi/Psemu1/320863/estExt_fgenesh1_pm.C_8900001